MNQKTTTAATPNKHLRQINTLFHISQYTNEEQDGKE